MQLPALAIQYPDIGANIARAAAIKSDDIRNRLLQRKLDNEDAITQARMNLLAPQAPAAAQSPAMAAPMTDAQGTNIGGGPSVAAAQAAPAAQPAAGPAQSGIDFNGPAFQRYSALDPQGAANLLDVTSKLDDRQRKQLDQHNQEVAQMLLWIEQQPDAQKPQAYAQARAQAAKMGMDLTGVPEQYDKNYVNMAIYRTMATKDIIGQQQKPTTTMQNVEAMGLKPGTPEYNAAMREAVMKPQTQINNNIGPQGINYGDPPKDMAWARDASGKIALQTDPKTGYASPVAIPITGGPVAEKRVAEAEKAQTQEAAQATSGATQAGTMLDATSSILKLMEDNKDATIPITGTMSRVGSWLSGTPQGKLRSYVDTLKSGTVRDAMLRLKQASAQGATGFGSMNEKELQILIDAYGALDPNNTDPEIFRKSIERIQDQQKRVIDDIRRNVSPERIKELGLEDIVGNAPVNAPPVPGVTEDGYRFKGGDPSKSENWEKVQ